MKEEKKKMERILQEKKIDLELDQAFELSNAASARDCTGTVVRAPQTEEEWESYDKIYHFEADPVREK